MQQATRKQVRKMKVLNKKGKEEEGQKPVPKGGHRLLPRHFNKVHWLLVSLLFWTVSTTFKWQSRTTFQNIDDAHNNVRRAAITLDDKVVDHKMDTKKWISSESLTKLDTNTDFSNSNGGVNILDNSKAVEMTVGNLEHKTTNNNNNSELQPHSCPPPPPFPSLLSYNETNNNDNSTNVIYAVLFEMVEIFNEVNCPYFITAGTLLGFVRECRLWSDLDFAIPLEWWKQEKNAQALQQAMDLRGGYTHKLERGHFGTFGKPGYEESWRKHGIDVDFFSILEPEEENENNDTNNDSQSNQNVSQRQATSSNKKKPYFVEANWAHGRANACPINRTNVEEFLWGNTTIRAPTPFDFVLTSYFGKKWMKPFGAEWRFGIHPFRIGSCTRNRTQSKQLLTAA